MDELKKLFERCFDMWHWVLGLVSGVAALWKFYRVYGDRFYRAIVLADAVYDHLGPKSPKQFLAEYREQKRNSIVRESRLQLVEKKLELAVYLCSETGECEWVNTECAELLGIERVDCLGLGWFEGVDAPERSAVYDSWMHSVAHKLSWECRYTLFNRRIERKTPCVTYAYPHLSGGKLLCYVGYITPETSN